MNGPPRHRHVRSRSPSPPYKRARGSDEPGRREYERPPSGSTGRYHDFDRYHDYDRERSYNPQRDRDRDRTRDGRLDEHAGRRSPPHSREWGSRRGPPPPPPSHRGVLDAGAHGARASHDRPATADRARLLADSHRRSPPHERGPHRAAPLPAPPSAAHARPASALEGERVSQLARLPAAATAAAARRDDDDDDEAYKRRVAEQLKRRAAGLGMDEDEDEEESAERAREEARRRRAAILAKHAQPQAPEQPKQTLAASPATANGSARAPPTITEPSDCAPAAAAPATAAAGDDDAVRVGGAENGPTPRESDSESSDARRADDDGPAEPPLAPRAGHEGLDAADRAACRAHEAELRSFVLAQRQQRELSDELGEAQHDAVGGASSTAGAVRASPSAAAQVAAAAAAHDGSLPALSRAGNGGSGGGSRAEAGDGTVDGGAGGAGPQRGFDMFTDSPVRAAALRAQGVGAAASAAQHDRGDSYDDVEGYFSHRTGDVLNGRYKIVAQYGRGVFSTVVKCVDMHRKAAGSAAGSFVAIKIIRNNEMMRRAGEKEAAMLERLRAGSERTAAEQRGGTAGASSTAAGGAAGGADERELLERHHIINFFGTFDHEGHLCLAFEGMHQNLRQALRQHGHKRGIQIDAVRTYARHIFTALRHFARCGVIHADLKPDNMVVNERYTTLKMCDLGSALTTDEVEVTPLLQSRFYRAPEVMVGLAYGPPVDTWSAAVTLFELYTGRFLFQGTTNNAMLRAIQEVRGRVPARMLRKGMFTAEHFTPDGDFLAIEKDKVSGQDVIREVKFTPEPQPGKDVRSQLLGASKLSEAEGRKVALLADLLDKLLVLDPTRRFTPSAALKHPFITSK